ncbi:MAG: ABC transporter substrate-binding protein [Hyphomicrobiales bacterium]|nr:ABC transporter substrate-binding protein [Hyphomicrobiales bacterium]
MKRRHFVAGLTAAAVLPVPASGQSRKTPLIGFLFPGPAAFGTNRLVNFREGLRYSGWNDEQVEIAARFAENEAAKNGPLAKELLELKPDVLVAIAAVAVDAARAATKTTPIIAFDLETDPVAGGIAASLAHPGGNVSGLYFDFPDFSTKWMELLKETIPQIKSVIVVLDPASPSPQLKGIITVAGPLNIAVESMEVRTMSEFDDVFRAARARRPDAVMILSSPLVGMNPRRIADLTVAYRLPTISPFPELARAGGLIAYGVSLPGAIRQVGVMTGKVLKGSKPAELPIERPTRFELVVNAKTAKDLGLALPPLLLARADEVIE